MRTLNELKDWKEHAAAPKRAALIQEMEALIGATLDPRALADRIQQLQDDWKTVSKGVVSDSDADWQRFHEAAQSAYQPCREYFEVQAQLRQANSREAQGNPRPAPRLRGRAKRRAGGLRRAGGRAQEAPQEWRRHFPVERALGPELQEEFDATIGRLQSRLAAWHARNAGEKQSLIRRAASFSACRMFARLSEAIKRLQAQWKELGAAARDRSRCLWETFRGHCDAVFQKRQQALTDYTASLQANKARAARLCEKLEAARRPVGARPARRRGQDGRMALGLRDPRRTAARRGARAQDPVRAGQRRCPDRPRASASEEKEQSIADLLEAARQIHAYGWAVARAEPASELDALKRQPRPSSRAFRGCRKAPPRRSPPRGPTPDAAACSDSAPEVDATACETCSGCCASAARF